MDDRELDQRLRTIEETTLAGVALTERLLENAGFVYDEEKGDWFKKQ